MRRDSHRATLVITVRRLIGFERIAKVIPETLRRREWDVQPHEI